MRVESKKAGRRPKSVEEKIRALRERIAILEVAVVPLKKAAYARDYLRSSKKLLSRLMWIKEQTETQNEKILPGHEDSPCS
jgi:hypothetical protein